MEELIRIGSSGERRIGFVLIEDSWRQAAWPVLARFNLVRVRCEELGDDSGNALIADLTEALLCKSTNRPALFRWLSKSTTIIASVQTDLLDAQTIKHLEYIASTIIRVHPLDSNQPNSPSSALCELVQRQSGGKSTTDLYKFEIDDQGHAHNFTNQSIPTRIAHRIEAPPPSVSALPTSSFNLSMTADQKSAKDSMVLPYMRAANDDSKVEQKILAPDFDDEDPDDDLDI